MPSSAAEAIAGACAGRDGFEHVSVHPDALPHPILGFYLRADSLEEAESATLSLWCRAGSAVPELRAWEPVRAEGPLFRPDLEADPIPGLGWTE
ncbi:hypothetical protein DEJ51_17310 [Streptomyces venezuelae]|uniref:Uncharacterized protein n=1 Tax=Streptomyces venezuelae TaxID=54571 RepID=A0A5P2DKN0_STRVZ|nr:hypothetical protein [Streptomyces venezuelae]QES55715.1 hypothetical protein DEJ51_17310 [Streptomyces venezuelae]